MFQIAEKPKIWRSKIFGSQCNKIKKCFKLTELARKWDKKGFEILTTPPIVVVNHIWKHFLVNNEEKPQRKTNRTSQEDDFKVRQPY